MLNREAVKVSRILDANFNRAKEALRVAEDISRFILEEPYLTQSFKKMRHEISKCLLQFPVAYRKLLATRNSLDDIGRASVISDTGKKTSFEAIMIANLKRSQEALRVLEECSKVFSSTCSRKFQHIRFQVYELEKRSISKF